MVELKNMSLRFLIRDGNECTVESLIGDVDLVRGTRRTRLEYEQLHRQLEIRRNGPHPLLPECEERRKAALNLMFPRHFVKASSLQMTSSTYQTKLRQAKDQDTFCF